MLFRVCVVILMLIVVTDINANEQVIERFTDNKISNLRYFSFKYSTDMECYRVYSESHEQQRLYFSLADEKLILSEYDNAIYSEITIPEEHDCIIRLPLNLTNSVPGRFSVDISTEGTGEVLFHFLQFGDEHIGIDNYFNNYEPKTVTANVSNSGDQYVYLEMIIDSTFNDSIMSLTFDNISFTASTEFTDVANDYDGDGISDILLRNTEDGSWQVKRLDRNVSVHDDQWGTDLSSLNFGASGDYLSPVGFADFNNDGIDDVLVRNEYGGSLRFIVYPLNYRTFPLSTIDLDIQSNDLTYSQATNLSWRVKKASDFNKDGFADLLLRHDETGEWRLCYYTGESQPTDCVSLALPKSPLWEFKSVGFYNNDAFLDILMRNAETGIWWLMPLSRTGEVLVGSGSVNITSNLQWKFQYSADFNNDAVSDVLLQNIETGQWWLTTLNTSRGLSEGSGGIAITTDVEFEIEKVSDFNLDGKLDVLIKA